MADFGFVGPSYEAPSIYQDDQECINFYLEIDPNKGQGTRGATALYPTPGLVTVAQLPGSEVRAMQPLFGTNPFIMIAVCDSGVYKIDLSYTVTQIGTLSTTSGNCQISYNRDPQDGIFAYIVDGPNRYFYVPSTNVFTQLASTDGPWQGATTVDVIDNYNIYNEPGTNNWAATDISSPYSTNAYYGTKDGEPDPIVAVVADHRQVYLFGSQTTEVWVDVGSQIQGLTTFPFSRISGTMMQHGCAAVNSVYQFEEQLMFVSQDARGQGIIGAVQGYTFVRLSNHAVEQSLMNQKIDDAKSYTYRLEGHEMYVVVFPSIDLTWVYDLTTKVWHKWLSWNPVSGYHRHRSNCGAFFGNVYLVGDYENGKIYQLDNEVYTEDGNTIRRLRRCPHLVTDLQREYFAEMQIQFQPGVGLSTNPSYIIEDLITENGLYLITEDGNNLTTDGYLGGVGYDPQAMLRWSSDGGSTWSNEHWVSIGKIGKYNNRAIWRRLGWSRDRIFEVAVSDPIKAVIVSANLKAEGGEN